MFVIKRFKEIYKKWKKENKDFFSFGLIKGANLETAIESFICCLRMNDVSITDIDAQLSYVSYYWDLCQFFIPYLTGFLTSDILNKTEINTCCTIIVSIVVTIVLKKILQKSSQNFVLSEVNFINMALQRFKDLYSDDMQVGNKFVEIYSSKMVSVPINSEYIYGEKMKNSKYYRNVFHITILNGKQNFKYIWFSNTNYISLNNNAKREFFKLCKKQIGVNWKNVNFDKISFKKLEAQ